MTTPDHHDSAAPTTMHDLDKPATLFLVYGIVIVLALTTIFLSSAGLGRIALPVQLAIGTVQAVLVAYHFMHLRRGDTVVTLTALSALFFMAIMFILIGSDVMTRWRGGL